MAGRMGLPPPTISSAMMQPKLFWMRPPVTQSHMNFTPSLWWGRSTRVSTGSTTTAQQQQQPSHTHTHTHTHTRWPIHVPCTSSLDLLGSVYDWNCCVHSLVHCEFGVGRQLGWRVQDQGSVLKRVVESCPHSIPPHSQSTLGQTGTWRGIYRGHTCMYVMTEWLYYTFYSLHLSS